MWHHSNHCVVRHSGCLVAGMARFFIRHKTAVAAVAVAFGAFKIYQITKNRKLRDKWNSTGRDVVVLHTIQPGKTLPSLTPFGVKLETFFRMTDITYVYDYAVPMGPKGKLPWITLNGEDYTDSELIMKVLMKHFNRHPDEALQPKEKAVGQAMRVMVEDHLYWGLVSWRYLEDKMKSLIEVFEMPCLMRLMFYFAVGNLRKSLHLQGLGRHSIEELHDLMTADIEALSDYLGDKDYLLGSEPHTVDCAVFGMLVQIIYTAQTSCYYRLLTETHPNLATYCNRMKDRFWPDWDDCLHKPKV